MHLETPLPLMAIEGLSILIPTWDRPEEVRLRLKEIAEQFGPDQRVHVQVKPGQFGLGRFGLVELHRGHGERGRE